MNKQFKQLTDENQDIVDFITSCSLFGDLPADVLPKLIQFAEVVRFDAGEAVLHQNQENHAIFILMEGSLGVYVDGDRLANLVKKGDLVGEMSVITAKPCSASIIAETPAVLFSIRVKDLASMEPITDDRLQQVLYRMYAVILADKLRHTNDKARQFEATNIELVKTQAALTSAHAELEAKIVQRTRDLHERTLELEASKGRLGEQHAELWASHGRLEELASTRAKTIQKLAQVNQSHVEPLHQTLADLLLAGGGKADPVLRQALTDVKAVAEALAPFQSMQASEIAWRSQTVLLAESSRKQLLTAKTALGGTGINLQVATDVPSGLELVAAQNFDIICASWDMIDVAQAAHARHPATKTVFMTSLGASESIAKIRQYPFLANIVAGHDQDRARTVKNILTTVGKLVTGDIFGIDKYLNWGAEIRRHQVTSSETRWDLVEELETYLQGLGLRSTIIERCQAVAEELLSNAIYDAPVDDQGVAVYNHLPRVQPVELKAHEVATLRYGCDGMLAAVSVEDPFGALPLATILDYLDSCYGGRHGSLNAKKGGAGMGVYQIIESADLVVFNIKRNVKTEVIALFNLDVTAPRSDSKFFHYFSE